VNLILDLSPAAINRTAMYHVSLDTAEILEDVTGGFSYFGQTFKQRPAQAELRTARQRLDQILQLAVNKDFARVKSFHMSSTDKHQRDMPTFFLDPLYVLFSELSSQDTVLLLDMSTVTNPDWHNEAVGALYEIAFAKISRYRPKLMAISHNTANAYIANFGYPSRAIEVVHLYVPEHLRVASKTAPRFYAPSPYFLFVGSLEARKNVAGAIEAFRVSDLAARGYQLLIAGGQGHGGTRIENLVRSAQNVHLLGFVSNDDLHSLYAGAAGFVYPSYLEGFGVPLLEAMLYGLPAIASVNGACPEVGGDIVSYVDPDDHASIAEEMIRIAEYSEADRALVGARSREWVDSRFKYSDFKEKLRRAVLQ
jgi:glycosyltransferase involved in cell wall biosynthesis